MTLKHFSNGNELIRFVACDEPVVPADDPDITLTWAMVVIQKDDHYLLHYNFNRAQWECAGGGIEEGETVEEAAIREVFEETTQQVMQLQCRGVFKMKLVHSQQAEYAALYTGTIGELQPFVINNESNQITLWHPDESLDGHMSELSMWMITHLSSTSLSFS